VRNKHRALGQAVRALEWHEFEAAAEMPETIESAMRKLSEAVVAARETVAVAEFDAAAQRAEEGYAKQAGEEKAVEEDTLPQSRWQDKKWSRICKSFLEGTECPHEAAGRYCSFAHSVEELEKGLKICGWGRSCNRKHGLRPCCCRHPGTNSSFETADEVVARMNLAKELPKVRTEVAKVNKSEDMAKEIKRLKDENLVLKARLDACVAVSFLKIDVNAPSCSEKEWNARAFWSGDGLF